MVPPDSDGVSRVPPYSGTGLGVSGFRIQGFHLLWPGIPTRSTNLVPPVMAALQPRRGRSAAGLGMVRFRSPLLSESRLISFPPATEMFHFAGLSRTGLWIQPGASGVFPDRFPHSEIPGSSDCVRLPEAYRSLPRPSSTSGAKAFTVCP